MQKFLVTDDKSLKEFGVELKKILEGIPDWRIIGIDGPMQSGKSTVVTKFISKLLNEKIFDLDSLIKIDETTITYEKITTIDPNTRYIVDGILNKETLKHFGIVADLNIYVKKMANYGWTERNWLDRAIVSDYGLDENFKADNVERQIFRYHEDYSPVENADLIIEISEDYVTRDFKQT